MARKEVAYGAARDGEEGAAREAVEEAEDEDDGDVAGDGLGHEPDEVGGPGDEVDGAAAVELAQRAEEHGAEADAQHKGREAQHGDDARVAELGLHLGVGGRVDGAGAGAVCLRFVWVSV